jgi:membrane-bound lytic murein transglycosylase D
MNNMRRLLPAAALLVGACATVPPPPPTQASGLGPRASDVAVLRHDVQATYDEILVQESSPLEAAPSIPIPEHRAIHDALNLFTTEMRDDIQTSLTRSARYRKTIEAALHDYGLPKGLAYLPVIESAYLPSVTSRAGAHGIWQLMPDTAREYGLRVDWWIDERADPQKSAQAAAAYLNDLFRDFNDWPLALAAYNAGPGRIHRAMQSTGAANFWELLDDAAIPKETRGYVPTFYATLIIASDPATYGFHVCESISVDEKQVEVDGPLSLAYLAEVSGVDRNELRRMNPALRHAILPPGRTTINVPSRVADAVSARATTLKTEDADIAVCSFTLREGDTLKRLARAIGASTGTLMAMNALGSVNSAGEGDSIYLPVRARELGTLLAGSYYSVRKGDTMYSIAKRHGLSVEELRELNDVSSQKLHPGQRLRVVAPRPATAGN